MALDRHVFRVAASDDPVWAELRRRVAVDFTDAALLPSIADSMDEELVSRPSRNFAVIEGGVEKLMESLKRSPGGAGGTGD